MKEKVSLSYRMNLDHWQVAQQFTPTSISFAKVTEYV